MRGILLAASRARVRVRAPTAAFAALALTIGGCTAAGTAVTTTGKTLTLYISAPAGAGSDQSLQDVLDAERLAFQQRAPAVTAYKVALRVLTSSELSNNARAAIEDSTAIAYLGEIVPGAEFYDYDAKYTPGKSHHIIPARIPERAQSDASDAARRAFVDLGCAGMARVDIIVDPQGTPWVLEVNTVPGLTEVSLLRDAARAAGIPFDELCQRLVDHAVGRHTRRVGPEAL